MLNQHLIFILYSLCASVFKGEPPLDGCCRCADGRGVRGGGGYVECKKDHLCFVTRECKLSHSMQIQERESWYAFKTAQFGLQQCRTAAAVCRQSQVCWNAWKLNCAAQWGIECGDTSFCVWGNLDVAPATDKSCRLETFRVSVDSAGHISPETDTGCRRGGWCLVCWVRCHWVDIYNHRLCSGLTI